MLGENTAYYGQGGGGRPQDSNSQFQDNIPLRDHNNKHQDIDHVYDIENTNPKTKKGVGFGSGRFRFGTGERTAWVVWFLTIVQVGVFIAELSIAAKLTGSPIQTKPFSPVIGPSPYVLINMGSRYAPCMRPLKVITESEFPIDWPCPKVIDQRDLQEDEKCRLNEVCGLGANSVDLNLSEGVRNGTIVPTAEQIKELNGNPNQWFRFITPMFLHAGIIHIGFNMIVQITLARDMEKSIGHIRFTLVYIASGIFGFIMGGNFAGLNSNSVGASGALFGIIALTLLDLLYHWSERKSPFKDLLFIFLDIAIIFVLGLLPGLDNFAHIGGFLMGLVLGICLLHSPAALRKRIGAMEPPYQGLATREVSEESTVKQFAKAPVGFFKGRKAGWWAWWLVRAAALVAVLIVFIVLLKNFYAEPMHVCSWCHRLSCLPISDWCEQDKLVFTVQEKETENAKRALEAVFEKFYTSTLKA